MFGRRHLRVLDAVQAQFRARQQEDQQRTADADAPPDSAPPVPYTRRDVYHIAFLLTQVLLPELVPTILSFADIFEWQRHVDDRAACITEHISPQIRLTAPIRSPTRTQHPVQRVVFTIRARDQGWADADNGNWTWFSAVIRPSDRNNGETNSDVVTTSSSAPSLSPDIAEHTIMHNVRAHNVYETHVIEWRRDSPDPAIREWMACLVPGHEIVVKAWARFPGWQNYVEGVKVDIWSSVVVGQSL